MSTKLTYSDQLKHPNWQRKRLESLSAANFECRSCGDKALGPDDLKDAIRRKIADGRLPADNPYMKLILED